MLSRGIPRSATFQLGAANDSDDEVKEGTANDAGTKSPPRTGISQISELENYD